MNKVLSSLIAILLGGAFGGMLLVVIALTVQEINFASAWDGIRVVLAGVFNLGRDVNGSGALQFGFNGKLIGDMLFRATPLIMTGLSVAVSYKTGLFNIGAPGQYLAGTAAAIVVGLSVNTEVVPSWIAWLLALLAAMLAGAVWGAIPGIFKAYFNVNEVITSIMFNWIGLYLVNELMYTGVPGMYDQKTTRTYKLSSASPSSLIPDLGLNAVFKTNSTTIAIFFAVAFAILVYVILSKTTFGYELKACGFNKDAAKYAGINEKRNIVLSMTISGALAGIGAGLYFLSGASEWNPQVSTALPAVGFNGIPVALLALSNPIGVIFAAIFVAHISVGGSYLPTKYYQPEIADLIVAVIIYLCAFVMLFKEMIRRSLSKKKRAEEAAKESGKGETK